MKRTISAALVLVFALGMTMVPDADAGWLDKLKKDEDQSKTTHRYDFLPTMSFNSGVLGRDTGQGWPVGGFKLVLAENCRITSDVDRVTGLEEGRTALVMGSRLGDTIVAWQIEIRGNEFGLKAMDEHIEFTPSENDPTVGEGSGPE